MAYTPADLEKLDQAIAKGLKKVKIDDKEVEFNTVDEMLRARRHISKELGLTKKSALGKRITLNYKKGV